MWIFERKNRFKKQFKRLDPNLQKKVETILRNFAISDDPSRLGVYKKSMRVFAYELDKSNRLLYDVDFENKIILLIRVGDHKSAYGSD